MVEKSAWLGDGWGQTHRGSGSIWKGSQEAKGSNKKEYKCGIEASLAHVPPFRRAPTQV